MKVHPLSALDDVVLLHQSKDHLNAVFAIDWGWWQMCGMPSGPAFNREVCPE